MVCENQGFPIVAQIRATNLCPLRTPASQTSEALGIRVGFLGLEQGSGFRAEV